ncbi:MAG: tetraacyldisaccharide 4'-kinase [Gammaproteobacteria bacterium]|nr:tetraacyldisaccharide 4'-kinase [Gammaproteobacteria bacterium]
MRTLDDIWYTRTPLAWPLLPLSALYCAAIVTRRLAYRWGLKKTHRLNVPVIVVGNLTVGGTGKTPLVIWLTRFLREHGYRPGLVARGYGGKASHWPQTVTADSDPTLVGDEPVMLARATGCPMMVAPDRVAAARALLAETDVNVIISDDGLQHYALGRDIEIAVVDGERRFGNGHCLPAGPLREPARRLREVDLIVANGVADADEFAMRVNANDAVNLQTGERRSLDQFRGQPIHAIAGIGNPERFFNALRAKGLRIETHAFPDHHAYRADDLTFGAAALLMTEKDAVKCQRFAQPNVWAVGTQIELTDDFAGRVLALLRHQG